MKLANDSTAVLDFPPDTWEPLPLPLVKRAERAYRLAAWNLALPKFEVPEPKNAVRRNACEEDLLQFALTYFPEHFFDPSNYHKKQMKRMQDQLLSKSKIVFKTADCAPRGLGKTTLRRIAAIWAALYCHEPMTVFIKANEKNAEKELKVIKMWLLNNELLNEDFPEICGWARNFEGDPKRCPPGYSWLDSLIILPNGCMIGSGGLFTGLAGLNVNKRPGFLIVDDVEDSESARSVAETANIANTVAEIVLQLYDKNRRAVYEFLGTVRTHTCNFARWTDPERCPGWEGIRFKGLMTPPKREDLWAVWRKICCRQVEPPPEVKAVLDEIAASTRGYRLEDYKLIPNDGYKNALKFYVLNKAAMDEGAEVFDPIRLPLVECFRIWAEEGERTFRTEIQQEPWEEEESTDVKKWDTGYIAAHATGYNPMTLPADCFADFFTLGADVHNSFMYYVLRAWAMNGTSWLYDAGIEEVYIDSRADKIEVERAMRSALLRLFNRSLQGIVIAPGTPEERTLGLRGGFCDEGWEPTLVRSICDGTGGVIRPIKGFGGLEHPRFKPSKEHFTTIHVGTWHFKHDLTRLLDRRRGDKGPSPGYWHLHNAPDHSYLKHMCAERWQPKPNKDGLAVKEYEWATLNHNNHWWDCEVYNLAAAYLAGVRFDVDTDPHAAQLIQAKQTVNAQGGYVPEYRPHDSVMG